VVVVREDPHDQAAGGLTLLRAAGVEVVGQLEVGDPLRDAVDRQLEGPIGAEGAPLLLRDRTGHVVWGTNTWHTEQVQRGIKKGDEVEFTLNFTCSLGPGSYSFSPALTSSDTHLENNYEWQDNAVVFDVVNADRAYFIGTSYLSAEFSVRRLAS
jgi:lipopolysaccharide transport system ATP-binding protein